MLPSRPLPPQPAAHLHWAGGRVAYQPEPPPPPMRCGQILLHDNVVHHVRSGLISVCPTLYIAPPPPQDLLEVALRPHGFATLRYIGTRTGFDKTDCQGFDSCTPSFLDPCPILPVPPPPPLRKHCYPVEPSVSVPVVLPAEGDGGVSMAPHLMPPCPPPPAHVSLCLAQALCLTHPPWCITRTVQSRASRGHGTSTQSPAPQRSTAPSLARAVPAL